MCTLFFKEIFENMNKKGGAKVTLNFWKLKTITLYTKLFFQYKKSRFEIIHTACN